MARAFEEVDYRPTPMGALSLRRRRDPASGVDIYEIKLDDEYLMSSMFTEAEVALARLGLAALSGDGFDVLVGGLGLGYTARAALACDGLRSLTVMDALPEVIEWHQRGLLPLGRELTADQRCALLHGDFFAIMAAEPDPLRLYHGILLDIDHAPTRVLHPSHSAFYTDAGLRRMAKHLQPGGVFALWSDDPPDDGFMKILKSLFARAEAHVVEFRNAQDIAFANTVYVANSTN